MTPTQVYEVLNEAFPGAVKSDAHGISWGPLRLERGSGIANRGGIWAITFPGHPDVEPITNIRNPSDLRRELRQLILRLVEMGDAVRKAFGPL